MNLPRSHIARPRFSSARWPAAHAPTANQLTRQDDSRPDRSLIQGVRSASVPASIGGSPETTGCTTDRWRRTISVTTSEGRSTMQHQCTG